MKVFSFLAVTVVLVALLTPLLAIDVNSQYLGCYTDDSSRDMIAKGPFTVGSLDECQGYCTSYSYFAVQYGSQCFCGNSFANRAQYVRVVDSECTPLNAGKTGYYGGGFRNAIYRHALQPIYPVNPNTQFVGCYSDDTGRDLPFFAGTFTDLINCQFACKSYNYFAMQNGNQCFCGNSYVTRTQYQRGSDAECTTLNAGRTGFFGGNYRNAIYRNAYALTSPVNTATQYVGCFVDDNTRDLPIAKGTGVSNAADCQAKCVGYKYFSLQQTACFCGDNYSTRSQYYRVSDLECSINSPFSGAAWRNAVYINGMTVLTPVNRPTQYMGCFVDDSSRDLPVFIGNVNNAAECQKKCTNWQFFGVQANTQCFCGNAYSTKSQYIRVSDSECGTSASPNELKGGNWRNAVYYNANLVYTPINLPTQYLGCFSDDPNSARDLPVYMTTNAASAAECQTKCIMYPYFAMQSGTHCFCGKAYQTTSKILKLADSECQVMNFGRPDNYGGILKNAVYRNPHYVTVSGNSASTTCVVDSNLVVQFETDTLETCLANCYGYQGYSYGAGICKCIGCRVNYVK